MVLSREMWSSSAWSFVEAMLMLLTLHKSRTKPVNCRFPQAGPHRPTTPSEMWCHLFAARQPCDPMPMMRRSPVGQITCQVAIVLVR